MRRSPQGSTALRALCLFNPQSGNGAAAAEAACQALGACGIEPMLVAVDSCDPAAVLAERAAGFERIIVCGGDGTLHALLPPLLELGRPIGLIPAGTANDFARSLGLPEEPEAACRVIAEGRTRDADVGRLGSRPFLNAVQIGLAADVARRHEGWQKKWLGVFGYPVTWLKAWRAAQPFRAEIEVDGAVQRVRAQQITVGSGRSYGGGMLLAEDAAVDDGLLRLLYVKPAPLMTWVRLFARLRSGAAAPEMVRLPARRVTVSTARPQVLSVDGEPAGTTPAVVSIEPRRLGIYAPPPTPEGPSEKEDEP